MMDNLVSFAGGPGGAGTVRRRVAAMPCAALTLALMAAAFLLGLSGTARALTVDVGGTTYELSVVNGTFPDNSATLQNQPWWGNADSAESFRDAAFAASNTTNKTINNEFTNYYAYSSEGGGTFASTYNIDAGNKGSGLVEGFFELDYVTATEVTPVPEIDGAVLAQLTLVLGTLWLVFGVGRRGDGETPAA